MSYDVSEPTQLLKMKTAREEKASGRTRFGAISQRDVASEFDHGGPDGGGHVLVGCVCGLGERGVEHGQQLFDGGADWGARHGQ